MTRIYLDNAATSWPKPLSVSQAVDRYQRENGTAVGRSTTEAATDLQKTVDHARRQIARIFGAKSPDSILFTYSGTDSLNTVFHGWLRPGDHVVTTDAEHNSVLRPLKFLAQHRGVSVDYIPVDATGRLRADDVRAAIRPTTRLVAVTHASNVTGVIQPVKDVGQIASERNIPYLVDAAQTAGHVMIDVEGWDADFVACPGHKGLLGPLGTGVLYVHPGRQRELLPLRQGGTGTASDSEEVAERGADRFEAGNHNAPGLVGLAAGVDWILEQTVRRNREHEIEITGVFLDRLAAIPGVTVVGPRTADERVGTVSIQLADYDPQSAAAVLDSEFGIEVRSGLHCAPRMHASLGTDKTGGTIRFSFGAMTPVEHVRMAVDALRDMCGSI